jgi:hypothetical protein
MKPNPQFLAQRRKRRRLKVNRQLAELNIQVCATCQFFDEHNERCLAQPPIENISYDLLYWGRQPKPPEPAQCFEYDNCQLWRGPPMEESK